MSEQLQVAVHPSHAHPLHPGVHAKPVQPRQTHVARPTTGHRCQPLPILPALPAACPSSPLWAASGWGRVQTPGARPSHPLQGRAAAAWGAGRGVKGVWRASAGAPPPVGQSACLASSAAHRMSPQTRAQVWKSAADAREARCQGSQTRQRGEAAGVGGGRGRVRPWPGCTQACPPGPHRRPAGEKGRPSELPGRCWECEKLILSISGLWESPCPCDGGGRQAQDDCSFPPPDPGGPCTRPSKSHPISSL